MGKRRRLEALRRLGAKLCSCCLKPTTEFVPVKRLRDDVLISDMCGRCAERVADENVAGVDPAMQPLLRSLQRLGKIIVSRSKATSQ